MHSVNSCMFDGLASPGRQCHFVSGDAEHPTLGARAWHCRSPAVSAGACVEQSLGWMCWASKGRGCLERVLAVPSLPLQHELQKVFSFSLC